jgi:hypothetical protein
LNACSGLPNRPVNRPIKYKYAGSPNPGVMDCQIFT